MFKTIIKYYSITVLFKNVMDDVKGDTACVDFTTSKNQQIP